MTGTDDYNGYGGQTNEESAATGKEEGSKAYGGEYS
jgi:hypothetical protein